MKNRIRADLDRLHEEIQWLEDDAARGIMDSLVADLELQLADSGEEPGELREQVEAAVTHFEADHPTVAGILKNILTTLGNIGI